MYRAILEENSKDREENKRDIVQKIGKQSITND